MFYVLIVSMVLSITLYEGILIITLLLYFYKAVKEKSIKMGNLGLPLVLYALPTLLSTALYAFKDIGKGLERSVLPLLSYILGERFKVDFYKANKLLVVLGIFVLPVVVYKMNKFGMPAPIWGGVFEVGNLYILFAFASFSLYLHTRKKRYLLLFFLFSFVVFLSFRRSAYLVFLISFLIVVWLYREKLGRKFLIFTFATVFSMLGIVTLYLVNNDYRFQTLYQVLKGEKAFDEHTFNAISSERWNLFKEGIQVIKKDVEEGNFLALLIGHGIEPRKRLEPNPVINQYESIFIVSELVEKGLIGTLGIIWIMISYYVSLLRCKIENPLLLSFLLALNIQVVGGIFTFFWDAMLPTFLVMYKLAQEQMRCEKINSNTF